MPADFSMPPNEAYRTVLNVLPADRRWFSFDVPIGEARKGYARRFGMTLWNYHTVDGKAFEAWAITRDRSTGTFWYRVGKERGGAAQQRNRTSLWEALQLAVNQSTPIPMKGILKDGRKRSCAPGYVFGISEVWMQSDDSALWLKLEVPDGDVGTEFKEEPLPPMKAITGSNSTAGTRTAPLPMEHYLAVRDAAMRVTFEEASRSEAIRALAIDPGINEGTAAALLNNFRCLVQGIPFQSPMQAAGLQLFIDAIVARLGDVALTNAIAAVEGYIDHALATGNRPSTEFHSILTGLKTEEAQGSLLQRMAEAATAILPSTSNSMSQAPSEILREVWVRGPQHAAFKRELLRRWQNKCSVHGVPCNDQLRASHIVAWSRDETIRGDVNNGLLLSVPLDSLFDRGLISFDDTGKLISSDKLDLDTAKHFGVRPGLRIAWDHLKDHELQALRATLARHREQHRDSGFPK
jgi:HNH endonuclease